MANRYGIKNAYTPSQLSPHSYGWTQTGAKYETADVPSQWVTLTHGISEEVMRQQFAYEWFQSGDTFVGFPGDGGFSNPPFVSGAAGRLHPSLTDTQGKPARILRGYIRRAEYELGDSLSKTRLYFMYNPETITRDYVSYLEQSALDPFNTVYQSGNLIAPPSILNFTFELFFDRQEEAANPRHPGVFVDYQFFDMVVRNVHPDPATLTGTSIPDSGVMMVNPRDITVIFSPQLSVQGRPTNAQVSFEKFTHRMTPTRMRIRLTVLASYFGPPRDMVEYKAEELPSEKAIPIGDIEGTVYDLSHLDVEDDAPSAEVQAQLGQANDGNHKIRLDALAKARLGTPPLMNAGLITNAYKLVGHDGTMGWTNDPGISTIFSTTKKETSVFIRLESLDWKKVLLKGDILISNDAIGFFEGYYNDDWITTFRNNAKADEVQNNGTFEPYTYLLRPTPLGAHGSAAQGGSYNNSLISITPNGVLDIRQTVPVDTGLAIPPYSATIRLSPAAAAGFAKWRAAYGGPIPCTSGWRDPVAQQKAYDDWEKGNHGWHRYAPADKSWHCKGAAVDVNDDWLTGTLTPAQQTQLRVAAKATGWGQARWRKVVGPVPGYECPCNWLNGEDVKEDWHFSFGGCG